MTISAPVQLNLLVVACIFMAGCQPSHSKDTSATPEEPSFAEQFQSVRDGRTNQIRLDHSVVRDEDLASLNELGSNLVRVNFSHTQLTDEGLEQLAALPALEQLRLASSKITDQGLECLESLKQLRFLHLIDVPITDAGLEHLHGLKTLESLYLDHIRASDEGIDRLIDALPGVHIHIDDHHHPHDPHAKEHSH